MLAECARILVRRWFRVVLAAVLAIVVGIGVYSAVAPAQESKAQILLIPSVKQPGVDGPTNPFVSLNGSISIVASVVQVAVSDQKTALALQAQGAGAKYVVEPNLAENAGPVLLITVTDTSVAATQKTMQAVIKQVQDQLNAIQVAQKVQADLFIKSTVLTASDHPIAVHKAQIQKAVIALLLTLIVGLIVILLLERRSQRRAETGTGRHFVDGDHMVSHPSTGDAIRPGAGARRSGATGRGRSARKTRVSRIATETMGAGRPPTRRALPPLERSD